MNKEIYLKLLADISSRHLSSYLNSKGWVQDGRIGSKAVVWHRSEDGNFEYEVIQPIDTSVRGSSKE